MTKEEYIESFKPRECLNKYGHEMFFTVMAEALAIMLKNENCTCIEDFCLPSWCPSCEELRYEKKK